MFRWLGRWLVRVFLMVAAATVVTYAADTLIYISRGSPIGSTTVQKFMGIPLKGQKEEYDYLGTAQAPCALALFPHGGHDACWWLRRYPDRWENL
jgi:hypothetical protein